MTKEMCPLLDRPLGIPGDKPDFCVVHCEGNWDRAVAESDHDSPYDTYPDNEECENHGLDTRYSHDSLVALSKQVRSYVIVEECVKCDIESGEQGFGFECPFVGE